MPHPLLEALTGDRALPHCAWEELAGRADCVSLVAASPYCPPSLRSGLLDHPRPGVRHKAAAAVLAGAPVERAEDLDRALRLACAGPDYLVAAAAGSHLTPAAQLERFATGASVRVLRAAWANSRTPLDAVRAGATHPDRQSVLGSDPLAVVRAAQILDAHPGALDAWIDHKAFQRVASRRVDCPDWVWPRLARSRSPLTKAGLGGNPAAPAQHVHPSHRERHEAVCAAVASGGPVPGGPLAALQLRSATVDRAACEQLDAHTATAWVAAALTRGPGGGGLWPDVVVDVWRRWGPGTDLGVWRGLNGTQRRALVALTDYLEWRSGTRQAPPEVSGLVAAAGGRRDTWAVLLGLHADWEGGWSDLGELAATLTR